MIRLKELMELGIFDEIHLIAGEDGLNKVVRWPFICQGTMLDKWVKGSELVFFTGVGAKTDPDTLSKLVERSFYNQIAGIVVLIGGEALPSIPQSMIETSNYYHIPLFTMPWEMPLVHVTKVISDYLYSHSSSAKIYTETFRQLFHAHSTTSIRLNDLIDPVALDANANYHFVTLRSGISPNKEMTKMAKYIAENHFKTGLFHINGQDFCFLASFERSENIAARCENAIEWIQKQTKTCAITYAGISNSISNDHDMKDYYQQATDAVYTAFLQQKQVKQFSDCGLIKVISKLKDQSLLEDFYLEILEPVLTYDAKHGTDLVHTLHAFLLANGSYKETAKMLYIHRNTLSYRIKKIKQLLQKDLKDPYVALELRVALLMKEYKDLHEAISPQDTISLNW